MSREYLVEAGRFVLEGFGKKSFLEGCGVDVPEGIGPDEMCVVCRRPGARGEAAVWRASDFASAAVLSPEGGRP
jgi:hypothetical protein